MVLAGLPQKIKDRTIPAIGHAPVFYNSLTVAAHLPR
jgi:hypothetical protein